MFFFVFLELSQCNFYPHRYYNEFVCKRRSSLKTCLQCVPKCFFPAAEKALIVNGESIWCYTECIVSLCIAGSTSSESVDWFDRTAEREFIPLDHISSTTSVPQDTTVVSHTQTKRTTYSVSSTTKSHVVSTTTTAFDVEYDPNVVRSIDEFTGRITSVNALSLVTFIEFAESSICLLEM